jgi:hypothetical protein
MFVDFVDNVDCRYVRDIVDALGNDNNTLRDQMCQTEKDTIDVISYLKKEDLEKHAEVDVTCTCYV